MKNANNKNGFSVLEMAITITIISLLIVATLTGQNVKHRNELAQVITDIGQIGSAVGQFRSAYGNFYPGDIYNATSSWSTTTNGDGDNIIQASNSATKNEELLFWQHLLLSKLLSPQTSGTYDGTTVTGNGGIMISSMPLGFYKAHKSTAFPPNTGTPNINATSRLVIQVSTAADGGVFTTAEAYDIDAKYDNTNPVGIGPLGTIAVPVGSVGSIVGLDGAGDAGNCLVDGNGTSTVPTYKTATTTGTPCVLYFYLE